MAVVSGELHPFRLALRSLLVTGRVTVRYRSGFLVSLTSGGHTGWGEASPLPGWSQTTLLQTEAALRRTLERLGDGATAFDDLVAALADTPHARAGLSGAWADLQARRAGLTLARHLAQRSGGLLDERHEQHFDHPPARRPARRPGHPGHARGTPAAVAVSSVSAGPQAGHAPGTPAAVAVSSVSAGPQAGHAPGTPAAAEVSSVSAGPQVGAPGTAVAVSALVAAPDPQAVAQAARRAAEDGFTAVKLKVGAAAADVDVDRVRAARAALGPGPELRLDANGAWDHRTALDVLSRVQACDIAYCEEPVSGIEAMAALARQAPVPVAVDESMRGERHAELALELGVRTLIVKPQALGGPDVGLCIAARALRAGASVVVTSFIDSAVGLAHALHLAAAVDAVSAQPRAHGLATAELLATDVAVPPAVADGVMALPAGTGIGLVPAPARSSRLARG